MSEKKSSFERVSAIAPFGLRMLPDLRDRIAAVAKSNGRSMNAEIVSRLEVSLAGEAIPISTIHVRLDTGGMPTSWGEIHEHLNALSKAGGFHIVSLQAQIITPEMIGSDKRTREASEVAKKYRTLHQKKA